jgi:succinate dehydrogenase / fumarate reductase cytochrome b subunit
MKDLKNSRPLSPHLGIYKPLMNMALSMGHRLSGIGLFVAMAIICWWFILWVFSGCAPCYLKLLDNNLAKAFSFLVSYGFFYHLCTGIRHLVWDTGRGFSKSAIDLSGWVVVFSSVILTAIFWFNIWGGTSIWL